MNVSSAEMVRAAHACGLAVPAFNIPYLPMVKPVAQAVADCDALAFLEVARLEFYKFEAVSLEAVRDEFLACADRDYLRLHLDHVPVIDEDHLRVDYVPMFQEALRLGYDSVMIDGSRLPLEENIEATRQVAEMAHAAGVACEAELGAIMGHEDGPMPPYEEVFKSGRGFTQVDEAARFVHESGCDWLSVAIGSIHGAISAAFKDRKKDEARLDLEHLQKLSDATKIPLVLHGGTGIRQEYLLEAMKRGIAKVNVATEIRQPYEAALRESGDIETARNAVYRRTVAFLEDYIRLAGTRDTLLAATAP